jgi:hypothetical protein
MAACTAWRSNSPAHCASSRPHRSSTKRRSTTGRRHPGNFAEPLAARPTTSNCTYDSIGCGCPTRSGGPAGDGRETSPARRSCTGTRTPGARPGRPPVPAVPAAHDRRLPLVMVISRTTTMPPRLAFRQPGERGLYGMPWERARAQAMGDSTTPTPPPPGRTTARTPHPDAAGPRRRPRRARESASRHRHRARGLSTQGRSSELSVLTAHADWCRLRLKTDHVVPAESGSQLLTRFCPRPPPDRQPDPMAGRLVGPAARRSGPCGLVSASSGPDR